MDLPTHDKSRQSDERHSRFDSTGISRDVAVITIGALIGALVGALVGDLAIASVGIAMGAGLGYGIGAEMWAAHDDRRRSAVWILLSTGVGGVLGALALSLLGWGKLYTMLGITIGTAVGAVIAHLAGQARAAI